jgi:hypothetical protein
MIVWNRRMPRAGQECFRRLEGLGGHARMLEAAELRSHPRPDLGLRIDEVFAELALSFDDDGDDPGAAGRLVPSC